MVKSIDLRDYPDHLEWAQDEAALRHVRREKSRPRGRPSRWEYSLHSCWAEAAVAVWCKLPPLPHITMAEERRQGHDVAGFSVRSTDSSWLRINLGEEGRKEKHLLVLTYEEPMCVLVAWIWTYEAMLHAKLVDTGGEEEWYKVPTVKVLRYGTEIE